MKKRIYLIAVLLVVTVIVGTGFISKDSYDFSTFSTEGLELDYNVPTEAELIPIIAPVTPKFYLFLGKSYLGFKEYDTRQQEAAFLAYTSLNKWVLRNDIKRYAGKTIGGVKVTESGILAAAHLAGAGNVKKFLRSAGENRFEDANGASIRYYLRKFSGYDTSHIVPNKRPRVI